MLTVNSDAGHITAENDEIKAVLYYKRSEEHTSELQSHSFISYAVFCLKKKNCKLFPRLLD